MVRESMPLVWSWPVKLAQRQRQKAGHAETLAIYARHEAMIELLVFIHRTLRKLKSS